LRRPPLDAVVHRLTHGYVLPCSMSRFSVGRYSGAEIAATCLTSDGMPNDTSIAMPGIGNDNGSLVMEGSSASFRKSCCSIMLHPSIDRVELTASCRKTDGSFEDASISIDGISNEDGTLSD
ncbi:CVNH domain-containing protein, partial [Rhodovulum sulfidophilum]|uniref:CVNH domain-containing protein n=2 Tax=Rhodovulum sulfidophilum TaxID=35806 RepID=UPI0022243ECE